MHIALRAGHAGGAVSCQPKASSRSMRTTSGSPKKVRLQFRVVVTQADNNPRQNRAMCALPTNQRVKGRERVEDC